MYIQWLRADCLQHFPHFAMWLLTLFLVTNTVLLAKGSNETHYTAAVVEYNPQIGNLAANLQNYLSYIQQAKSRKADIIVFPENGLNGRGNISSDMETHVPAADENLVLCMSKDQIYNSAIKSLSCFAMIHQIYVVVNLAEFAECSSSNLCNKGKSVTYNTNVVFDRNGAVIARYRKHNLYIEPGMTSAPAVPTYFDTDFGVRFGTFICFDILFATPTLQLTRELGIKHIVFPTAWYHELPFLNGVQVFSSWAYSQDVTLLVAGYNAPENGTSGSGIFQGKSGPVIIEQSDTTLSKMYVATLPKDPSNRQPSQNAPPRLPYTQEEDYTKKPQAKQIRLDMTAFETILIENLGPKGEVCDGKFCCRFEATYTKEGEGSNRYRAVVFNGSRDVKGHNTMGVQACGVVSCENDRLSSCATRVRSQYTFTNITISGRFDGKNSNIQPSTLYEFGQLLPLAPDYFQFNSECQNDLCDVTMNTAENLTQLVTFGIHSRIFALDGKPKARSKPQPNTASLNSDANHLFLLVLFCCHSIAITNWN